MEDRNLSLSTVAGSLGVSERTVRRWIKSGKLKAYKPGRDYRIPESALRELVEESEISPKAPRRSSPEPSLFNGLENERRYRPNDRDIEALEEYLSKVERQLENGKMQRVEVEHELDVLRAFGPPTYAASGDEIANRILDLGYELLEQGRHLKLREIAEAEASVGRLDELRKQRAS